MNTTERLAASIDDFVTLINGMKSRLIRSGWDDRAAEHAVIAYINMVGQVASRTGQEE